MQIKVTLDHCCIQKYTTTCNGKMGLTAADKTNIHRVFIYLYNYKKTDISLKLVHENGLYM